MAETWVHQMEKKSWHKLSFYVNIILFIIVAVSVIMIILDSYNAGKQVAYGSGGDQMFSLGLYLARDIAFFAVALALIFFQFFRNLRVIILRSW